MCICFYRAKIMQDEGNTKSKTKFLIQLKDNAKKATRFCRFIYEIFALKKLSRHYLLKGIVVVKNHYVNNAATVGRRGRG